MSAKSQLKWRCRRGMRELDVLLDRYLETQYTDANPQQQAAFEALLELQDPVILRLVLGKDESGNNELAQVLDTIRGYH